MSLKHVVAPFTAWARAFAKPWTVPQEKTLRPGADRYRGWHVNQTDKCVGCGTCGDVCQNEAIDMVPVSETDKGDSGLRPQVDYGRCCWCALCVDVCPSESLGMSAEYVWVDSDPDVFRYTPGVDPKPWDDDERGWRKDDAWRILDEQRVPMAMLDEVERRGTWAEVVVGYTEQEARREASRCIECGVCISACPAHMHIPDYIAAIRDGEYDQAVRTIYQTNPMPEMCGKVCTRRCEDVCAVGINGDPVAIRWLKRFATERFDDLRAVVHPGVDASQGAGKTVAVIGGGPSGITVAYYLAIRGYGVTIFEALPKLGGATFLGIPKYRFPIPSLDKQVALLEQAGVEIRTGTRVDPDLFATLREEYDAVFVGTGLMSPRNLRIAGEDAPGVLQALDFLRDHHLGKPAPIEPGQRVVVVGGGNTAIDAARVAVRMGAEVSIEYRRRKQEMPADHEEIEDAEAEGIPINVQVIPLKIEPTDDGRLDFVWGPAKMVAAEEGGRPRPVLIEGVENHLVVDRVIAAIGQGPDLNWMGPELAGTIGDKWGWIQVDERGMTAVDGVFAGGDLVNETADAISAIADGLRVVTGLPDWLAERSPAA